MVNIVKLGDICTVVSGSTPKTSVDEYWNGNVKWITPAELDSNSFYVYDTVKHISELGRTKTGLSYMPEGTVILSSRAPIGKTAIAGCEMCCNQGFKNLICSDRILNKYLFYFLKSKTEYLNSLGRGATFKELSKSIVENIEIPLPSIEEQMKISEKFICIDNQLSLRKLQLKKLDELVKSRFIEMFYKKDFPIYKWNDVFNTITGKLDSNAMVVDGEYPFFTCAKETFRIDKYAFDQEALLLAGNNAAGKYDVKYYKGKFNAYQRTYVLSLKQDWSYQLFRYQLEDKLTYLQEQSKGSNTRYITLKILGDLEFIVPPIDLQNEFANFVEQTDKLKFDIYFWMKILKFFKNSYLGVCL